MAAAEEAVDDSHLFFFKHHTEPSDIPQGSLYLLVVCEPTVGSLSWSLCKLGPGACSSSLWTVLAATLKQHPAKFLP